MADNLFDTMLHFLPTVWFPQSCTFVAEMLQVVSPWVIVLFQDSVFLILKGKSSICNNFGAILAAYIVMAAKAEPKMAKIWHKFYAAEIVSFEMPTDNTM